MSAKFNFKKLDADTRKLMLEEIQTAHENDQLYMSARFTAIGTSQWPTLLKQAAELYDEHWLSFQLEFIGAMKDFETKEKPKGGYTVAHVPHTAAETFADGQFNRFYIAAICRRAIVAGQSNVTAYRAKQRGEPRSESRALEGAAFLANELLSHVRRRDDSLRCELLKPNSGLSVNH